MARRHWLDPLARRLLIATGQLSAGTDAAADGNRNGSGSPAPGAAAGRQTPAEEELECDLLALKLAQNPALRLRDAEEVRRAAALGWRLDVNRATAADWLRLPGCRPEQADLLLRLQAGGVQLSGPEDLQRLLQLDGERLRSWQPLLSFRWYGEPATAPGPAPVAVNSADPAELQERLGLSPERCRRLLRERGRAPFRDLAELQQRLQLPPELVEDWIGRVAFEAGGSAASGPVLPPTRPPGRR